MNKWIELLIGLIFVIVPIILVFQTWGIGFWDFGTAAWDVLKGGLMWFVFFMGLLFILLGLSDLKG